MTDTELNGLSINAALHVRTEVYACPYCKACYDSDPELTIRKHVVHVADGGYNGYRVTCKDCHMRGPLYPTEVQAINAWNALPRCTGDR